MKEQLKILRDCNAETTNIEMKDEELEAPIDKQQIKQATVKCKIIY